MITNFKLVINNVFNVDEHDRRLMYIKHNGYNIKLN